MLSVGGGYKRGLKCKLRIADERFKEKPSEEGAGNEC